MLVGAQPTHQRAAHRRAMARFISVTSTLLGQKQSKSFNILRNALHQSASNLAGTPCTVINILRCLKNQTSTGLQPLIVILLSAVRTPTADDRRLAHTVFVDRIKGNPEVMPIDTASLIRLCKVFKLGPSPYGFDDAGLMKGFVTSIWESGEHSKAAQIESIFGYSGQLLDTPGVLHQFLQSGCFASLQMYAENDRAMKITTLEKAIAMEQLTMADKLATTWKLHSSFPDLHRQVHESRLSKLITRGKVHQAHGLCGTSKHHLTYLVKTLVENGKYSVAREFKAKSGVDVDVPDGDDKLEEGGINILNLACGMENVHMVATPDDIARLRKAVMVPKEGHEFNAIGLDCEWKPVNPKS